METHTERRYLLGKLRQAKGHNSPLCHQAGDEIQLVRKECRELVVLLARIEEHLEWADPKALPEEYTNTMRILLDKHG